MSLSARRAWIEILKTASVSALLVVALRKESVDRNNRKIIIETCVLYVALRKESVDRNFISLSSLQLYYKSLSARRAWIEIRIVVRIYPR